MVNADLGTLPPDELRQVINSWPTFTAQKIQVTDLADDWTSVTVRLDLTPENANYFGTAFGGSLFSMIDPFIVLLIARQLRARSTRCSSSSSRRGTITLIPGGQPRM